MAYFISSFLCSVYAACITHKEMYLYFSMLDTYYQFRAKEDSFKL